MHGYVSRTFDECLYIFCPGAFYQFSHRIQFRKLCPVVRITDSKKGLNIKVNTLPVAAIPRARTLGETDGLFKVVVDADTNKILGCSLFGPETSEIINIVSIVMKTGQEYTFLRDYIFTHPSMSEALNDLMNF